MNKDILLEMVEQNQFTSRFSFDKISQENAALRLNDKTASIGFIYRHIGETLNLFGQLLGTPTEVRNTTMGQIDDGRFYDVAGSRELVDRGYQVFRDLAQNTAEDHWLQPVDTPFFGTVSRVRLFAHALFHNAHHAGQISLTLSKGK